MSRRKSPLRKFISRLVLIAIIFVGSNFLLSEIADWSAYREPIQLDQTEWNAIMNKISRKDSLSDSDYENIYTQTGLGKPAVKKLIRTNQRNKVQEYYNYYKQEKSFECVREGVFAYHEYITDEEGNPIYNPQFADLQNGDIIVTLSIHSFGWRHGHAAIVTDASNGTTVQAVMMGEQSNFGNVSEFSQFPLVAVLRAKDTDTETRQDIANYATSLVGIDYSLFAGMFEKNTDEMLESTQCAHLVWYAYNKYGIDIDSNGGDTITPKDILNSDKLEIVQVYGSIEEL